MKKWILAALIGAATMGNLLDVETAQAQGGGPGGGGGGFRRSPKGRLSGLIRGIGDLEKEKKAPLTKDQAKKILAAMNPWKAKPKMTEDEAKALFGKLNTVLSIKQKNELDKMVAKNRRFGSGDRGERGGPGGGSGGGAGGGGGQPDPQRMAEMRQRMQKFQGFRKTSNPFYPPEKYKEFKDFPERMREGMTRGYKARLDLLRALAAKAK